MGCIKQCIKIIAITTFFFIFVGCNLFNPSGNNKFSTSSNTDSMILTGYNLLRDHQYTLAAKQFEEVLKIDSTKSEAWYGLCKANIRHKKITAFDLLEIIENTNSEEIPFVNELIADKNNYYQGLRQLKETLDIFVERDSLTQLWQYSVKRETDSEWWNQQNQAFKDRVISFDEKNTIPIENFPLSDQKICYQRISIDYTIAKFGTMILEAFDFDGDGIISENEPNLLTLLSDSSGGEQVLRDIVSDPDNAEYANSKIQEIQSNASDVTTLIEEISQALGDSIPINIDNGIIDSLNSEDSEELDQATVTEIEKYIADFGDALNFYMINDSKDNDGDGCIDEEIYDGVDNDGDGFIDEDLRSSSLDVTSSEYGIDFKDNDFNGLIDEADEVYDPQQLILNPNASVILHPFAENFVSNVNGFINSPDAELKIRVAADSLGLVYSLQDRKDSIGGCWHSYTSADFTSYKESYND